MDKPIFKVNDNVKLKFDGEELNGKIVIVDKYGTYEQQEEPSYDILVDNYKDLGECLIKHIRQSRLVEIIIK